MDFTQQSPVILSICPGFLGLERGLERAFYRLRWQKPTIAAYVEIEAFICANLVAGMEAGVLAPAPIWTDVKTFDPYPFRGKLHGYIGGYPCQPFSVAGKQRGTDDPRHLWPYIKYQLHTAGPLFCFFENVPGHLNIGYREVRQDLEEMGYAVEEGIFSAEEVGAPHRRERLFILAIKRGQLADTTSSRTQGNRPGGEQEPQTQIGEGLLGCGCGAGDLWPSRPGQPQYDWEAPRTVEPGLGCTVDGYNFREDLLRAYGNSVVEQTAELAFLTLLEKFEIDKLL